MDLEYIESLYAKYRDGVICKTHEQRVQVIEYFLSCGIEHGHSGYSRRVYDNYHAREEDSYPNIGIYFDGRKYVISGHTNTDKTNSVSFDMFLFEIGVVNIPSLEEFV